MPIPWRADAPAYGFSPTGTQLAAAAASPGRRYARDRQVGVAGSTYELYRAALRLRREHALGDGTLEWLDLGPHVVAFVSGDVLVVANVAGPQVALPAGWVPVLRSDSAAARRPRRSGPTSRCGRSAAEPAPPMGETAVVQQSLRDALVAAVGDRHVLTGPDLTASYETDWTGAFTGRSAAVVRPADPSEVAGVLRACSARPAAGRPAGRQHRPGRRGDTARRRRRA